MELMTLNEDNQAGKLIEKYDSLIWTERFNTVGDFQLQTGLVERFMGLLPEGTMLTLRDSNIAMQVETHRIERKKKTPDKLIITGRSYEKILDQRVSIQSVGALTGDADWLVAVKTPSDLAYFVIVKICVEGVCDSADIFPSDKVQFITPDDYLTSTGPTKNFAVERGQLLQTVLALLQTEAPIDISTTPDTPAIVQHGIRAVRPNAAGTAIGIEIYTGEDKSDTVYFDATRRLLDDGIYLFSKVGAANAAYGVINGMAANMYEGVSEPTGLDRKVILVDGSTSGIVDEEILRNEMSVALSQAHETAIFDGSINPDLNPYVYGVDYNLGDVVKVVGDYGLSTKARVTEYIRSEDANGSRAFPTLVTIPEA